MFFILPLKVKWVAWAMAVFLLFGFVAAPNSYRMAWWRRLRNYLIFFGPGFVRQAHHRREIAARRAF